MAPNRNAVRNGKKTPDDVISFAIEDLKVREIEELEEIMDCPFDECFVAGKPKGKTMRVIGYLVKKRENPDFTMEQAGELRIILESADPT